MASKEMRQIGNIGTLVNIGGKYCYILVNFEILVEDTMTDDSRWHQRRGRMPTLTHWFISVANIDRY